MIAHRVETTIEPDGTLILKNLPFHSGEQVEVIVLPQPNKTSEQNKYPLRGTAVQYIDPTEPVADDDWQVAQ